MAKKVSKKIAATANEAARMLGSRGGKRRAENMTGQERIEAASKAARARWDAERAKSSK